MQGIMFNLKDVKNLATYLGAEQNINNLLFIVIRSELKTKLDKSMDKKLLINSQKFKDGIVYHCCALYNSKDKVIEMVKCDREYVKLFDESAEKFLDQGVKIVARYRDELIDEGFANPTICGKKGEVCLVKDPKSPTPKRDMVKLDYAFILSHISKKICEIIIKINSDSIVYLNHINKTSKSKEIFGKFNISDVRQIESEIVYTISIDKSSLTEGKDDEIEATPSLYNFHSHPEDAYKKYNVMYGPPSTQDYKSIYMLATEYNTIVHFVSSIEGLYVVYLKPDNKFSKSSRIEIIEKMRFENAKNILELEKYIKKINSFGLFNVRLIQWKSSEFEKGIRINFSKSGKYGNCLIRDM